MRKAALGIGVGAAMIVVMYVGQLVSSDLAGNTWPVRPMELDFRDLPKQLGDWTVVKTSAMDPDILKVLAATDAEERTYENTNGVRVSCHNSIFKKFCSKVPHSPVICYPNSGWEALDFKLVEIPLSDGTTFKPALLSVEKQGEKAYVLFWFQLGDFVATNNQEMRAALNHYRPGREWPTTMKVLMHMPADKMQNPIALQELAANVYEYTRTLQEGKGANPPEAKQ